MERTLLLNATYEPLTIISWRRAITLLYLGKSELLEEYNREIICPSLNLKVPSVIRLHERIRSHKHSVIRFTRHNLYARDNHRCQYCGRCFKALDLTFDHVKPRCRGGRTSWTNIVACCVPCNQRKADQTLAEVGMRLINKPMKPVYLEGKSKFSRKMQPESWRFYIWKRRR